MIKKTCPECAEPIYGRSDKKFCSDYCRNIYNNKLHSDATNHIRNINNILRKNRRILSELLAAHHTQVPVKALIYAGYNFKYYTHSSICKSGGHTYYCYDCGYQQRDGSCHLFTYQHTTYFPYVDDHG